MRYESLRKPRKCPKCNGKVAKILFGMPAPEYMETFERLQREGKVIHWGCCVSDDDPSWGCINRECDTVIYKKGE
jgi:hypothetical protein